MKGDTTILIALGLSAAAVVGIVLWGRAAQAKQMAADNPIGPTPIGPFPDLKVGTVVVLNSKAASLPPPFSDVAEVPGVVDMILSDPFVVSVAVGVKGIASFNGTVPRSSIVRILQLPPPAQNQIEF